MATGNELGEYLRLRRGRVRPEDVGLVAGPRRRVEGLRREELAALAGISADYYLRIEQGRTTNPSPQILDALARALRLDAAATAHLHDLASDHRRASSDAETVGEEIGSLIDQLSVPAFVAGRYLDCLASNAMARALSPNFVAGSNLLETIFLDPAERRLYADWPSAAAGVVGGLRQASAGVADDTRLDALVSELGRKSPEFETLWKQADVGFRPAGLSHFRHPHVGDLRLRRNRFLIPDSNGQHLQIYHALPGTDAAEKLSRLAAS